jgi:hypothetical protein
MPKGKMYWFGNRPIKRIWKFSQPKSLLPGHLRSLWLKYDEVLQ